MKKLVYFAMILFVLCNIAFGEKWVIDYGNVSDPLRLQTLLVNRFDLVEVDIQNLKSQINLGTGKIFYVDSAVGSNSYDGTKPEWAKATLDAAVALCTANNGDIIYVMQGHNEALTAADGVDIDVAGVTVIGLGNGTDAPTFDYDGADGEFVIGAANVKIYNLRFLPSVNIVTHAIDIEIAGDYACIYNCYFLDGETAGTDEFVDCIQVGTTATDVTIANCTYFCTGGNANNFIDLSAAAIVNPTAVYNVIYGAFAEAGIWAGAAVPTNCLIGYNIVSNTTAGQFAIEFQGAATGVCIGNLMYTDAAATTLDPGSLMCLENYGTNAIDLSAIRVPPLPAIGTVTAGSADDILKKLYYTADGTGAYPATVANDSTIAKIISKGSTATASTFDNATDSLEAISDSVEKCIEKSDGAVLNGADPLFTITGGPILVTKMVGIVTTVIGGIANGTLQATTTTPAGTVALSTTVAIDNDAAGTSYRFVGATGVLTPVTAGAVIIDPNTTADCEFLVPIGNINFLGSAAQTGVIKWYMTYKPLSPNSVVIASP